MGQLSLSLLGAFKARTARGPALGLPKKSQAMLAYLALAPGYACARGELATLLWGDTGDAQARQSLRQALRRLRTALGARDDALRVDTEIVALEPGAIDLDTADFQRLLADGGPEALGLAVTLYRGDLLAGLDLDEAPFAEWLLGQRERFRELAMDAVGRLLARHTQAGAVDDAMGAASRLLAIDPLHEGAHRAVMRAHAARGRRTAALRQYQACVDLLQRELGVEPETETKALYRDLVREQVTPGSRAPRDATPSAPWKAPPGDVAPAFVGRAAERERLRGALDDAVRGRGRVAAILGEAGIGKTGLVRWLADEAAAAGARVLIGGSFASEQIVPFAPWTDALRTGLAGDPELLKGLAEHWKGELAHLLPELLAPGTTPPPLGGDPVRLFETVVQVITFLADARPLVVVLEDLHWADEISLRLLAVVSRRLQQRRLLVAATVREEELADHAAVRRLLGDLARAGGLLTVTLPPLVQNDIAELVRALAHRRDGGAVDELIARIWTASEGHPLIAVETVRAVEEGTVTSTPAGIALPERVRDVIVGRLERVNVRASAMLAAAAVIGRGAEFPLLGRAAGLGEMEAATAVEELVRRRLLRVVDERFELTHDRIRDVIESGLVPPRRQLLHRQVAGVIESLYGDRLAPHFAALGRHWYEAGEWQQAARYLHRAGLGAFEQSANHEAVASLRRALDALGRLPETPATLGQGIDVRFELRHALLLTERIDRVAYLLDEAQQMAERLGDPMRTAGVAAVRAHHFWWSGQSSAAEGLRLALDALAMSERVGHRALIVGAASVVCESGLSAGDYRRLDAVVGALRQRYDLAQLGRPRIYAFPALACLCTLGAALAERGEFDRALATLGEALALAEGADHRPSLIAVHRAIGEVHLIRGEAGTAVAALERAIGFCRDYEVAPSRPITLVALGYAYVRDGRIEAGMRRLHEGLDVMNAMGWLYFESQALVRLAEALLIAGRAGEAHEVAQRALALTHAREQRGTEVRALRLLAEIAVRRTPPDVRAAEDGFTRAMARAVELGMEPEVGHVHFGLGRLYRRSGARDRARTHLAAAAAHYARFGITPPAPGSRSASG